MSYSVSNDARDAAQISSVLRDSSHAQSSFSMADTFGRPVTPPPRSIQSNLQSTPEHVRQIEINRLKGEKFLFIERFAHFVFLAKAAQRQRESEAAASSVPNANHKRPLSITTSPTAPIPSSSRPLKPDSRIGKYFEYDLSKMVNSKGGFLVEDGEEVDQDTRRKEMEREKQRAVQNLEPRTLPGIFLLCQFLTCKQPYFLILP